MRCRIICLGLCSIILVGLEEPNTANARGKHAHAHKEKVFLASTDYYLALYLRVRMIIGELAARYVVLRKLNPSCSHV